MNMHLRHWNDRCDRVPAYRHDQTAMRQFFEARNQPVPDVVLVTAELTDTFGGEANYAWVRRTGALVPADWSERQVVILMKRKLGINGRRCTRQEIPTDTGTLRLDVRGVCLVAFIDWHWQ